MSDIKQEGIDDKINDKLVISTANLIPNKRHVTRNDVNNFVDKIKKSRKEKLTNKE